MGGFKAGIRKMRIWGFLLGCCGRRLRFLIPHLCPPPSRRFLLRCCNLFHLMMLARAAQRGGRLASQAQLGAVQQASTAPHMVLCQLGAQPFAHHRPHQQALPVVDARSCVGPGGRGGAERWVWRRSNARHWAAAWRHLQARACAPPHHNNCNAQHGYHATCRQLSAPAHPASPGSTSRTRAPSRTACTAGRPRQSRPEPGGQGEGGQGHRSKR